MLHGLLILLASQMAGEAIARGVGLGVPGPVIGMALLAVMLLARPGLQSIVSPIAGALLSNLSLLFIPAAVGVVQILPLLAKEGLAIGISVLISTVTALIVTALTFRLVVRLRAPKTNLAEPL